MTSKNTKEDIYVVPDVIPDLRVTTINFNDSNVYIKLVFDPEVIKKHLTKKSKRTKIETNPFAGTGKMMISKVE